MKVIYIAGAGRSGSTRLENCLGQCNGYVALGELRYLWERGVINNEWCGCGKVFSACDFWRNILRDLQLEGSVATLADDMNRLSSPKRVLRDCFFSRTEYDNRIARVNRNLVALYTVIDQQTASSVIVDSSKEPLYLHRLRNIPGIELYVIHLVRDARGVAYSWLTRKARHRPDGENMQQFSVRVSTVHWVYRNLGAAFYRGKTAGYIRIRYEDFVADPEQTLNCVLSMLETPQVNNMRCNNFPSRIVHTVAGNPARLLKEPQAITEDVRWKTVMRLSDYLLSTVIALPLLVFYRYRIRRS